MFLRHTIQKDKKNRSYKYYKIVESYWDKKLQQSRQKTLLYLGKLSDYKKKKIKMILKIKQEFSDEIIITKIKNVSFYDSYYYLNIAVIFFFWNYWKLNSFFKSLPTTVDRDVSSTVIFKILTANRCIFSLANQNIPDWTAQTAIPFIENVKAGKINEARIHRGLDFLYKQRKKLQRHIRKSVIDEENKNVYQLYYDFSYIIFEGKGTEFTAYNKGIGSFILKKKLLLSLLVTENGYPLDWEVLPGKATGVVAIKKKVKEIKKMFSKSNLTLIFDRAMVSHANLNLPFFKKNKYITGLKKNQIKNIIGDKIKRFKNFTRKKCEIEKIKSFKKIDKNVYLEDVCLLENRRYILGFNKTKFEDDRKARNKRIKAFETEIKQLNTQLKQAKKSRDEKILISDVFNLARSKRVKSYYKIEFKSLPLKKGKIQSYEIKLKHREKKLKAKALTDGLFMLVSNLTEKNKNKKFKISKEKILADYRSKDKVEKAFQNIKSFVKIEPVRHKVHEKIISHVDICILSYLINITIYNKLKQNNKTNFGWPETVYRELRKCKIGSITVDKNNRKKYNLNETTSLQKKILKQLDCLHLISDTYINSLNFK